MSSDLQLDIVSKELDVLHANARRAFLNRDIASYRAIFTDDLRYVQPNGEPIGLKELMRDVSKQISQFKAVDSEFTRETIAMNGDGTVSQFGRQRGSYSVSVFFFFTKTWTIERLGRYTYRRSEDGWRVCAVEVMAEKMQSRARQK